MDYVRLAPGLPPSSRLGFGCGSIMGRVGRAESLRAIAMACDAGITHFDVARLYGYGEAETLLGEALRGRRDQVVIASKFGLVPTRAAVALRGLKPIAQKLVASIPGLRPLIRGVVGVAKPTASLSPEAAEQSLNESLRALGTDYLDILLLHDGGAADFNGELVDFLKAQVAAGKIRAYGISTGIEAVAELIPTHGDTMVYQFGNSVSARDIELLPPASRRYVTHNPFRGADRLLAAVKADPARFRLSGGRAIAAADIFPLMLGYALSLDSVGAVLCSMLQPEHLRANLAAAEQPAFAAEEIAAFVEIVGRTAIAA